MSVDAPSAVQVADAAAPHRRMRRIGHAALLAACLAITAAAGLLVGTQLRQAVLTLQEVQARELQSRGSTIATRMGQARAGAEVLTDMAEALAGAPTPCPPVGGVLETAPLASGTPPAALAGSAPCLSGQLRLPLLAGQVPDLRRVELAGPDWSLAFTLSGVRAPALPGLAKPGFQAPVPGPDGTPEVLVAVPGIDQLGSLALALSTDGLWAQTFPLSGPEGEVLLLAPDGMVIVRGGALPGMPDMVPLPEALVPGDRAALLERLAGTPASFADGTMLKVLRLPDTDWYLVGATSVSALATWLIQRNGALLAFALLVTAGAWTAYAYVLSALVRPSQKLEEALDRTRANLTVTFDHMAEGLCLVGEDGCIVSANTRLGDLTGMGATAVSPGQPVAPLLALLDLPAPPAECRHARDLVLPDGRWLEAVLSPVAGRPLSILLVRDVTERKLGEIAVRDARDEAEAAYARSEELLLNVLPGPVADRLKAGEREIADGLDAVTVLFADIVDFTRYAADRPPAEVVRLLNRVFSRFDALCARHGVEKLKTIGDGYMAVAGAPLARAGHEAAAARLALDMQAAMAEFAAEERGLALRVGLHAGHAVAGVIGTQKFAYDIWGDTVNMASRLEAKAAAGTITVSEAVRAALADDFLFEPLGEVELKGRGMVPAWRLVGAKP